MKAHTSLKSLIGMIYDAAVEPSLWLVFLKAYAETVSAQAAGLMHHDLRDPQGALTATYRIDPGGQRLYAEHFGQVDPWIAGATSRGMLRPGIVHIGEELISHSELTRTEYDNDLAKPLALTRVLSAVISGDEFTISSITALRLDGDETFTERHRRLLHTLMPHLQRALDVHQRLAGTQLRSELLGDALNQVATGVLLVRHDGTILLANRAAEQVLNRRDGLACTSGGLSAMSPHENDQLHLFIRRAAQTGTERGTDTGGALLVSRPSNRRPLTVLVTPLNVPTSPPFDDARAVAGVFVSDPEDVVQTDGHVMRSLWGLTKTEAAIAGLFASGRNVREIAEDRAITLNTARWHLKRILAKTDTRTQADLARLLSVGLLSRIPRM